jgi:hypothetical protein
MPQSAIDKTFAPRPKYEQKHDRNYADKKDGVWVKMGGLGAVNTKSSI